MTTRPYPSRPQPQIQAYTDWLAERRMPGAMASGDRIDWFIELAQRQPPRSVQR